MLFRDDNRTGRSRYPLPRDGRQIRSRYPHNSLNWSMGMNLVINGRPAIPTFNGIRACLWPLLQLFRFLMPFSLRFLG